MGRAVDEEHGGAAFEVDPVKVDLDVVDIDLDADLAESVFEVASGCKRRLVVAHENSHQLSSSPGASAAICLTSALILLMYRRL